MVKNNNLYRIITESKTLKSIKEIEFSDFNFKERYDIQEWVESNSSILGEDLLIIGKELSYFDDTRERPDLIAIDIHGNIVIIELKRDDSGLNLEWQAIKYASYLSKFKITDILNIYEKYLSKYFPDEDNNPETIKQKLLEFIDEDSLEEINKNQRIILVSHRFAKEVTSAVNWLIDNYSVDVKCVQLIPFFDKDKESYYIQSNIILPVPGIDELLIGAAAKQNRNIATTGPVKKNDEITSLCNSIYNDLKNELGSHYPDKKSRWAGVGNNFRYFHTWFSTEYWDNWALSYKIWIYEDSNDIEGNVDVIFDYNPSILLNKGIDESALNELDNFINQIANTNNYIQYVKNITKGIKKKCNFEKDEVVNLMKELINLTYDKIMEIIQEE